MSGFTIGAGQLLLEGPTAFIESTLEKREMGFDTDETALKYRKADSSFVSFALGTNVILNDGTTPFLAPVSGVNPTAGSHLTTKQYVDSLVQGLDWQNSVIDFVDLTVSEPPVPGNGDRYISTATGNGNITATPFTIDNIYEWNGVSWDEIPAQLGITVFVDNLLVAYTYNGTIWVPFGAVSDHNTLSNLQGGNGSSEFYHLDLSQFNDLHPILTVSALPLTLVGQALTFNYIVGDFDISGPSLALKGDVTRSDGTVPFLSTIAGITPVSAADLVTKSYADGLSASPAGADRDVQINDGGSFGGNAGFQYNETGGNNVVVRNVSSSNTAVTSVSSSLIQLKLIHDTNSESILISYDSNTPNITANSVANLEITNSGSGSVSINGVVPETGGSTQEFLNRAGGYLVPSTVGIGGVAIPYTFSTDITPPPSSGQIHYNNATQTSATKIFINEVALDLGNVESLLNNWQVNSSITVSSDGNSGLVQVWNITVRTDQTNYVEFDVTLVFNSGGNFSGGAKLLLINSGGVLNEALYFQKTGENVRLEATSDGLDSSRINIVDYVSRAPNGFPSGEIFLTADSWSFETDLSDTILRIGTLTSGSGKSMQLGGIIDSLDEIRLRGEEIIISNSDFEQDLSTLVMAGPRAFRFKYIDILGITPETSSFRFNADPQGTATKMFLDHTPLRYANAEVLLETVGVGSTIFIMSETGTDRWQSYSIDVVTPQTGYVEYDITNLQKEGADFFTTEVLFFYIVEAGGGGGGGTLLSLTDVSDSSYSGNAGKVLTVNGNETETILSNGYVVLFSEDWESNSFATNGWSLVNNGTNDWEIGTDNPISGTFSGYISNDGGTTNAYNLTVSQVSHMYVDIVIPFSATDLKVKFDWKCAGESGSDRNEFDLGILWMTDTSFTPSSGTVPTESGSIRRIGRIRYVGNASTQADNFSISEEDMLTVRGTTQRFIFTWKNDNSAGAQVPWIVDNIEISAAVIPITKLRAYPFSAADFNMPNNSNWSVTNAAGIAQDSLNNAIVTLRYDGTSEEAAGFDLYIPDGATTISFKYFFRPQTLPGSAKGVKPYLKYRDINTTVLSWASQELETVPIANSTIWDSYEDSISLDYLGITNGEHWQFQVSRLPTASGDDLTGDWDLKLLLVRFT